MTVYAALLFALAPQLTPTPQLEVHDLAVGGTVRFDISAGPPNGLVVMVLGFGGSVVSGPCLDPDACIVVVGPYLILGAAALDAAGAALVTAPIPSSAPLPFQIISQAITLEFGPTGVDFGASGATGGSVASILSLSESFEPPTVGLDGGWATLHPELGSVDVTGGELILTPSAAGLPDMWFDDGEGLAVLRQVTGDFELTTRVNVHAPGDPATPPATGYRLGGLVLRDATQSAAGTHGWCHVATGSGGPGETAGVEWKETHGSVSQWAIAPTPDTDRELRLVRTGDVVTHWHRAAGAPAWTLLHTSTFPGLPATVEVGAMAYSFSAPAGVVARFEELVFGP